MRVQVRVSMYTHTYLHTHVQMIYLYTHVQMIYLCTHRYLFPHTHSIHVHPKTLFEIAMALFTISVSFPSKSRFYGETCVWGNK